MAEFQYEVIHRPGKQHCNADSLSRGQCRQCGLEVELETDEMFPVCEISLLPAWTNQEVADFQRADTDLEQVITWLQYPNNVERIRLGNSNPSGLSAKTCC